MLMKAGQTDAGLSLIERVALDADCLTRSLRANVIRARTDGCIRGRIYWTQSDLASKSIDALATQGESIYRSRDGE